MDASVYAGQNYFSIGMVTRNHQGHYVEGKTMQFGECVPMMEAELVEIAEALKWIGEVPMRTQVTLESDSLLSIDAINSSNNNLLEMGNLISLCREFLKRRNGVKVGYIRKQANRLVHSIARIPCKSNSFVENMSPLSFLLETFMYDYL